ncbi:MAG: hypothetical protein KBD94_06110, partial [Pyrinomonadaceae bacterium]|nr:hypothetical protein [Pyrinomonadaceae bacterium]
MNSQYFRRAACLAAVVVCSSAAALANVRSDDGVWNHVDRSELRQPAMEADAMPTSYDTFRLDRAALRAILDRAPEENTRGLDVILTIPMPDGTFQRFSIEHSLVVEKGLLKTYPELGATYRGTGIDDPTAVVRLDLLPNGFHAMVLSARSTVIVDPYSAGGENYISYFKSEKPRVGHFECLFDNSENEFKEMLRPTDPDDLDFLRGAALPEVTSGSQMRTYRLALAATNEYCATVGSNTVAGCLAAQVLVMNRVNGIYNRDVAIQMNIIANNNLIVFAGNNTTCPVPGGSSACTAANDPYTNDNGSAMLDENQNTLDTVIGSANYDIGHVFSTGGGGIAQLNSPCGGGKARGVTGLPNPVGDPFSVDYVSHEMGHQWGSPHTFNAVSGGCSGNRSGASAYEPGSGITIMGYSGLCSPQNLANFSIDTFHVKSLELIVGYSQTGGGNSCAVATASGNTPPIVTGPGNFNIPKQTPFSLTASATDPNGDTITYDWEEYDLGPAPAGAPNTDADGNPRPIFRVFSPVSSGTRTFPALTHILNSDNIPPTNTGGFMTGELLPAITRTMTFQVVARDNRAGAGGINTATSILTVDGASGPFKVTFPDASGHILGTGTNHVITWNVAGTNGAPINAANVRILYSSDGGTTFPTVLVASTANDGSETVTMPGTPTSTGRIKVEAVGNVWFDVSNNNFTLTSGPTPTPSPTPTPGTPTPTPSPSPTCNVFAENFDGVTEPALPAGWVAVNTTGPAPLWTTSTTSPNSPPNSLFIDDPNFVSDKRIDSPAFVVNSTNAQLSFRHKYDLEYSDGVFWDGAVLEMSVSGIVGGTFLDVTHALFGNTFLV